MTTAKILSLFLAFGIFYCVQCANPRVEISSCFQSAIWIQVYDDIPPYVNLNDCMPQTYIGQAVLFAYDVTCFGDPLPGDLEVFTVYIQQGVVYNPATDLQYQCYCDGQTGTCSDPVTTTSDDTTSTSFVTGPPVAMISAFVTPRATMTLTDNKNIQLTTVYIGDPVKLHVILENPFVADFDIIGWNCLGNSFSLIENGCSVVSYFPTFTHPEQGHLIASFTMFKFVSSNVINFHCTLKVCAGMCNNTITCPNNMNEAAWGWKRRDVTDTIEKGTVATIETSIFIHPSIRMSGYNNNGSSSDRWCNSKSFTYGLSVLLLCQILNCALLLK